MLWIWRCVCGFMMSVMLVACAAEQTPLAPPDYDRPSNANAEKAFKAALHMDMVKNPYEVGNTPDEVNAVTFTAHHQDNRKRIANKNAKRTHGALQRMTLSRCEWAPLTQKDYPQKSQPRLESAPAGAYDCAYTAYYQINPPYGKKYMVEGDGHFFREQGKYHYAGKFTSPYLY